ncbi:chemotaxis protein CheD [Sinisalibacter aestuarii]|uniref:Probable chemoreceptor glutamine deamidase CheD n=1 Tax=Sinisalibacter aestuarii TaxID=2949426 RepID=A0ABQ5LTV9_9RHOB|nr:chemotaxis protein CheD [Sinisalibacter aestuarii]GKY87701.1 putative chemoreceptor glutamine deamidase CheD [Sinisalibacter aestuarii]
MEHRTYIGQGEHAIDGGDHAVIATLLGSCVSACIWDPARAIGGMNHVLFVDESADAAETFGHGVNGMELLINGLLRLGATRRNLRAKVFGGAIMVRGLSSAGSRNGDFVTRFLDTEGIAMHSTDLGGTRARRIEFWPGTGRARLKYVSQDVPVQRLAKPAHASAIELF